VEISGLFGWTLSDGVTGDPVVASDGNVYDEIGNKDSASWGFGVGFLPTDQFEFGFLYNRQMSTLEIKGTADTEIGDIDVDSYHGYFGYNFGDRSAAARPYVLIGLGATHYGSVPFTFAGVARETNTQTQFSTTWGAGVKFFPAPNFGVRVGVHWTPTYIKSDPGGWWCDPFWGCYVVGDAQYSNQFNFNGGVTARF
jgi:hypothetical protein